MIYIQLKKNDSFPNLESYRPYKCVLVIEDEISNDQQNLISHFLVSTGCMYMMAWGLNCSSWDDSVDEANMQMNSYNEIPEEKFVIT